MTQIELRFFESAVSFFTHFNKKKEIDWEQRRYEIAKDMFTASNFGGNNGSPCGWMDGNKAEEQKMARYAVRFADALIEELKNDKK